MVRPVKEDRSDLDIARRQESKAYNELEYRTQQAKEQQSQLDSILEYREECLEGLANARETGLTPVHVREYQLLMTHINSVVETIEYKVSTSQNNQDKAQQVWQKKNEYFIKVKDAIKNNTEMPVSPDAPKDDSAVNTKNYYSGQK